MVSCESEMRKFERPKFLRGVLSREAYERWLHRKASAHVRRDRKRGNGICTGSGYRAAIHKAVVNSKGRDAYTRERLDWGLVSKYDNKASKSGGRAYKHAFALLPTVDHIGDGLDSGDFVICSWRTNDAKNDLPLREFLEVCKRVLEANRKTTYLSNALDDKKRLFKRIIHSLDDLQHAAECADQILQRDLHSATADADKLLLRALSTSLIVSYGRPFSGNRASLDVQKMLPRRYLNSLSEDRLRLHKNLMEARNRDHAHSDPAGRDLTVGAAGTQGIVLAIPIMRNAFAPWPRETIQRVRDLISVLLAKLSEDYLEIQKELKVGERF